MYEHMKTERQLRAWLKIKLESMAPRAQAMTSKTRYRVPVRELVEQLRALADTTEAFVTGQNVSEDNTRQSRRGKQGK